MLEELPPSQRIRSRVRTISLNAIFNKGSLLAGEEALRLSLVGKVDYDEPGADRDNLGQKSFNDLIRNQLPPGVFAMGQSYKYPLPASHAT
jgi:hypothetical protein